MAIFEIAKMEFGQKFFREIAFLAVLNFFPLQKFIFAIFEIAKKRDFILVKNTFREIDLFDFMSFFGLDFLKIFWPGPMCIMSLNFCLVYN